MGLDQKHEELLTIFDAMSGAWEAGDAAEFADFYTDDATVVGPGIYLRGRDHIRQSMAGAFGGPLKGSRRPHQPRSTRLFADGAIVVTRSDTVLPGEAQVPPEREHLVTWILVRQGGRWRVEANHMSPVRLDQQPEEA